MLREITSTLRAIDRATRVKLPTLDIKPMYQRNYWIDYGNEGRVYYDSVDDALDDLLTRYNQLEIDYYNLFDNHNNVCDLYDELAANHNNLCDEYTRLSCGETVNY